MNGVLTFRYDSTRQNGNDLAQCMKVDALVRGARNIVQQVPMPRNIA